MINCFLILSVFISVVIELFLLIKRVTSSQMFSGYYLQGMGPGPNAWGCHIKLFSSNIATVLALSQGYVADKRHSGYAKIGKRAWSHLQTFFVRAESA